MPTATLTWSERHGDSNPMSTFGATNQGAIQLLNQYFTALALFADFPWTVCSYEGTTAPWFLTLKRKSGAAGRIVFIAVTTTPLSVYNPQLGNLNWNAVGVRAAWFKNATSDTPANMLATSGDVFTNPAGAVGLGPNYGSFVTSTNVFSAWACEDGIYLRYGSATFTTRIWVLGELLEDDAGGTGGSNFNGLLFTGIVPDVNPGISDTGMFSVDGANTLHFGSGWTSSAGAPHPYLRDNALKRSWYLPISFACFELPAAEMFKYKFRQLVIGPTPLAAYERLVTTGDVLAAQSTASATGEVSAWLTNFKV